MRDLSLARDVADLTVVLARLGAAQPPVEPTRAGLDAALHARAAVLALARQMLTDVHQAPTGRSPGFADLHTRPAAVMAWAVSDHPSVAASQSPIDVARTAPAGSRTALWEQAATLATRTHVRWERADVAQQSTMAIRSSPARPALIADLAATMTALTRCEPAMATAASALGDHTRAAQLEAATASPLRLAAEATWSRRPPDAPAWDVRLTLDARRLGVLPLRDVAGLPHGLARLSALLRGDLALSPQHIALVISGQARIALALAARIPASRPVQTPPRNQATGVSRSGQGDRSPAAGPVPSRDALLSYARTLTGAWSHRDDALSTLTPSDPRPLQQIGECVRAAHSRSSTPVPAHALLHAVRGLDDVLVATCAAVEVQLQRGSWITSASDENSVGLAVRWQPLSHHQRPHVADALHGVRAARALPAFEPHRAHLVTAAAVTASPPPARRTCSAAAVHAPRR